jgi:hypothetical protein
MQGLPATERGVYQRIWPQVWAGVPRPGLGHVAQQAVPARVTGELRCRQHALLLAVLLALLLAVRHKPTSLMQLQTAVPEWTSYISSNMPMVWIGTE